MPHIHSVYDTDKHFKIDAATRGLENQTPGKSGIMQYDHNSERITFELPRTIEGHDMTTCNRVEVHYLNIDAATREQRGDIYDVTDLKASPEDEKVAICSWLIDGKATQLVGPLWFRLRFVCTTEGKVDYAWHTAVYKGLTVSDGIYNTTQIAEDYSDILAAWDRRLNSLDVVENVDYNHTPGGNGAAGKHELTIEVANRPNITATWYDGVGVCSIQKTASSGVVDTYTITYTNGSTSTFAVTNGKSIAGIRHAGVVEGKFVVQVAFDDNSEDLLTFDLPAQYGDTPFSVIDLPQVDTRVAYLTDGTTQELTGCSPVTKCPRYLGWRIESDAKLYLYIGDLVNDKFVLDEQYTLYESGGEINHLIESQNRFLETDGTKYFYYKAEGQVELIGADTFPDGLVDHIAVVPDFVNNSNSHVAVGDYYSVVLPSGSYYAVLVEGDQPRNYMNVSYETEGGEIYVSKGASFGYIPEDAGAALLRIPYGSSRKCPLDALRIYSSKPVLANAKSGKRRLAQELGEKLIRDFYFEPKKAIIWNDSIRAMGEGRRFYGIPYASRWRNSHYPGFEISLETLANALNDPLSIAYDGGAKTATKDQTTSKVTITEWWEKVSGKSEVSSTGGPGYGLTCSAFASLICGNPYPQTNRGFTFDRNFSIVPAIDTTPGTVMSNAGLTHCVFVDEVYNSGYALMEATDPCVAKTIHTGALASPGYLGGKTQENTLDNYPYSVANIDSSWYGGQLLNFDFEVKGGPVRPWRGHKAVYGPYDKLANGGSGIGVTIHDAGKVRVTHVETGTVNEYHMTSGAEVEYLDIEAWVDKNGTYTVDAGDGTVAEQFRFFDHEEVSLSFDAFGRAAFSHDDVNYVYARVTGYGGDFAAHMDTSRESDSGEPVVIAAGQLYPDLAANVSRIKKLYAAIVTDPDPDDCWGRYSVHCNQTVTSEYAPSTGGGSGVGIADITITEV